MKNMCYFLVVLSAAILFAGCQQKDGETTDLLRLSLATGGTAGTYYPIGSGIATIVSSNEPGIDITVESTGASVANLKMMKAGDIDMMMGASNTQWGGYNGQPPFDDGPVTNVRGVASLYPEVFQYITHADSDIDTIEDIRGKRVAVGSAGSGTERTTKMVLEAHGITYDDFDVQYLKFGEAATALRDRLIDVIAIGSGLPTAAVVDISATLDTKFIGVDEELMRDFLKDRPFLFLYTLQPGDYRGITSPIPTVASPAILSVREDMDEETVYTITKALFENIEELASVHAQGKNVKLETALTAMSIPLHPGAEKYYREKGIQ